MIFRPEHAAFVMTNSALSMSESLHDRSPAYKSLTSYWKLDEASGNRVPSVGATTLTDNNTVNSEAGLIYANATRFTLADSDFLSANDSTELRTGDIDWWTAVWFYLTAAPGAGAEVPLISKDAGVALRDYRLDFLNGTGLRFFTMANASVNSVTLAGTTSLSTSTWYLVIGRQSVSDNKIYISLNGGAESEATRGATPANSTAGFRIGTRIGVSVFGNTRMGPVMIGKNYALTAADRTFLYSAGAGVTLEAM